MNPLTSARRPGRLIRIVSCMPLLAASGLAINGQAKDAAQTTPSLSAQVSVSSDGKQAALLNRFFHGSIRSTVPDGTLEGMLDPASVLYVPTRKASGYLVPVPAQNDFDSLRISIFLRSGGKIIGEIRSGIVYWLDGQCVIGFGGMESPDGHIVAVRGYVAVAALSKAKPQAQALKPGEPIFLVPDGHRTFPVVIDHRVDPPSDDEDDD
ncbi:hypothetical protein R70006_06244 [Paraburkholderia domus]|uniref:hypothetical protein n=1 Tax=Paraburkholderia domus TaxID=2793075 RepID=UPI0019119649|nr:hypothetical protein [Paraburkholderia domus]MBK5052875.1 hypothetical protein [Burkholderia sp. R-70006]CAE6821961.1 hypothetical protein R70006_06244 [Paraburkholderia domus]